MKIRKSRKLNLGLLVDKPFPHPTTKDRKGITALAFDLNDVIFDLYTDLIVVEEFELAEKILKASGRIYKNLSDAFAAETRSEYAVSMERSLDALVETRFWLKELQMKFVYLTCCDEPVERVNEMITIVAYISEKFRGNVATAGFITVN